MHPLPTLLRRYLVVAALALLPVGLAATLAAADGDTDTGAEAHVDVLPLRGGFVDPPVHAQIADVLARAEARGSDLVVVQLSSSGGVSVTAEDLLATVEGSTVPLAVLVGPLGQRAEAQGAAALLWLAADIRAVAPDATVGPLDPVDLADEGASVADWVATRLEALGGPELATSLLTQPVDAAALESGGVATAVTPGLEPLLVEIDGRSVTAGGVERELRIRADEVAVTFHSLGLVRRVLHAATTAPFIYLLLVVGLGMLLFEVFQPGFGVAGLAGIVTAGVGAFGLTVLPVTWWAVALVVLGLLLYAADTAVAGFGPITLAATTAFAVGSANFYASAALRLPWWLVGATTLTVFVFFVFVMTVVLRAQAGPEGVAVDELVGRPGTVRSVLNPEGHVYIDGALWRARWTGDSRRAKVGTPVRVHAVDGPVVLVEPFGAAADAETAATSEPVSGSDG